MTRVTRRMIPFMCLVIAGICALMLASCAGQQGSSDDTAQQNRTYMTQVSEYGNQLATDLKDLNDAISRKDAVAMKTQATSALGVLDQISSLNAPDALKDVKTEYVDGCNDLKSALQSYVDIAADATSGTVDTSKYASKLKKIQDTYNSGIEHLKKGDELANQLNSSSSNSSNNGIGSILSGGSNSNSDSNSNSGSGSNSNSNSDSNSSNSNSGSNSSQNS